MVGKKAAAVVLSFLFAGSVHAEDAKRLTIVHTNDLGSRLLGFAPNRDYTPRTLHDDATVGGISRIATVIREARARAPESTLVVDGGDIMMGTLFQTLAEDHATELRLMKAIGYDAATLGNHEFDFHSDGLARIVRSAGDASPQLLLANIRFDPGDDRDDDLAALFERGVLRPYTVVERGGLRVGIFGLLGYHASKVSAYAKPASFDDPVETAREVVKVLREDEAADLVVCLYHGGLKKFGPRWFGDSIDLLRKIPEVDVVVSGHTHEPIPEPPLVDGRPVLQAGSDGRFVGILEIEVRDNGIEVLDYQHVAVDDSIEGAPDIEEMVDGGVETIDREVLAPYGHGFRDAIAETAFDLVDDPDDPSGGNLGPLVADAVRWSIDRYFDEPTDVVLTTAGMIRDDLRRGKSGIQQTSDVFRLMPLGIGTVEETPGYPLARVYFTPAELKSIVEVLLVGNRFQGKSYFPFFSGIRFRYNPLRPPLDQVFEIELGDEAAGYEPLRLDDHERLLSFGMSGYFLSYMHFASELSAGLFDLAPRDASGRPIPSVESALVDTDPETPGIQEAKEWLAVVDYLEQLPDEDGDGVADVPERYRAPAERRIAEASLNPAIYFKNTTAVTWTAVPGVVLLLALVTFLVRRRLRRRKGGTRLREGDGS